jgi:hypothetical protein
MEKDIIKDFKEWNVPTKWEDLSLKTYQDIERYYKNGDKEFNVIDVLDILTDKTRDEINELPAEFLETILTHLSFLATAPKVDEPSNKITINGETYAVNVMEKLKVGEYVAVDTILKNDRHDYASILAVLCRKQGEVYDSKYEAEIFEDRKKMFEEQPVVKILPIVNFFLQLYATSEIPSLLSSKVENAIDHIQQNIATSDRIGVFKKYYLNWRVNRYRKSLKSIKYT